MGCTGLTMKSSQDSTFQFMVESRHQDLYAKHCETTTRWCPSSLAKLVPISPITMVYGTQITIVTGAYKPTNITGGPHIVCTNQGFLTIWGWIKTFKQLWLWVGTRLLTLTINLTYFVAQKWTAALHAFSFPDVDNQGVWLWLAALSWTTLFGEAVNQKNTRSRCFEWWVQYLCDVCWMFPCVFLRGMTNIITHRIHVWYIIIC